MSHALLRDHLHDAWTVVAEKVAYRQLSHFVACVVTLPGLAFADSLAFPSVRFLLRV